MSPAAGKPRDAITRRGTNPSGVLRTPPPQPCGGERTGGGHDERDRSGQADRVCLQQRDQGAGEYRQHGRADDIESPGRAVSLAGSAPPRRAPARQCGQQQGQREDRDREHGTPPEPCGHRSAYQRPAPRRRPRWPPR
ncbi:hypothetical protein TPA0909_00280 [Streptomyces albus]|nr:hypothetical protein TPA0909_00280 [Streptomyces albus]